MDYRQGLAAALALVALTAAGCGQETTEPDAPALTVEVSPKPEFDVTRSPPADSRKTGLPPSSEPAPQGLETTPEPPAPGPAQVPPTATPPDTDGDGTPDVQDDSDNDGQADAYDYDSTDPYSSTYRDGDNDGTPDYYDQSPSNSDDYP